MRAALAEKVELSVKQFHHQHRASPAEKNRNRIPGHVDLVDTANHLQTAGKSVAKYSPALAGRVTLEEEAANLGTMFLAWLAAVLNKAALARAFFNCWPPRLERRIAERETRVIILG